MCTVFYIYRKGSIYWAYIYKIYGGKVSNEIVTFPPKEFIATINRTVDGEKLYTPENPVPFQVKNDDNIKIEYGLTKSLPSQTHRAIDAVIQTQSTDNGKTWSKPIITKDAKLFKIGKSILDQPAVAKPGKWKKGPG